jgi:hypothetical protein
MGGGGGGGPPPNIGGGGGGGGGGPGIILKTNELRVLVLIYSDKILFTTHE